MRLIGAFGTAPPPPMCARYFSLVIRDVNPSGPKLPAKLCFAHVRVPEGRKCTTALMAPS
jgi:hypothetical protein